MKDFGLKNLLFVFTVFMLSLPACTKEELANVFDVGGSTDNDTGFYVSDTSEGIVPDTNPNNDSTDAGVEDSGARRDTGGSVDAGPATDGGLAPALGQVGSPCLQDDECPTGSSQDEAGYCVVDLPGGYCVILGCSVDEQGNDTCPDGSTCYLADPESGLTICLKDCTTDANCRASEGYQCILDPEAPELGYCFAEASAQCTADADCPAGYICDEGTCSPDSSIGGSTPIGGACTLDTDCAGADPFCITEDYGFPGGYCTVFCEASTECGGDNVCIDGACWDHCTADSQCRQSAGYVCDKNFENEADWNCYTPYETGDCSTDVDCEGGYFCVEGTCVECKADADCSVALPKCAQGVCVECIANSDCGSGQVCNEFNTCIQGAITKTVGDACTADTQCPGADYAYCIAEKDVESYKNGYCTVEWCNYYYYNASGQRVDIKCDTGSKCFTIDYVEYCEDESDPNTCKTYAYNICLRTCTNDTQCQRPEDQGNTYFTCDSVNSTTSICWPNYAYVGDPCSIEADGYTNCLGDNSKALCLTDAYFGEGDNSGYCTRRGCDSEAETGCSQGELCIEFSYLGGLCLKECEADTDCTREGYFCDYDNTCWPE